MAWVGVRGVRCATRMHGAHWHAPSSFLSSWPTCKMTSVGFPFPASSIFGFRGIYGASALESTRSTRLHTVCSVSTKGLTTALKLTDVSVQQDVHEFMDVLFKRIEAELKGTAHSALITDLFQGEQIDYVHCLTCGTDSRRTDHFRDLKLVVPLTEPATGAPVKLTTNNYGMGGPWHTPLFDEVGGEGVVDGGGRRRSRSWPQSLGCPSTISIGYGMP